MPKEWLYQPRFDFSKPGREFTDPEGLSRFVREVQDPVYIKTPADAAQHLLSQVYTPFEKFDQEELWCLLLNVKNRITHEAMVYRGTVYSVNIRHAELFKPAVQVNAPNIILSHNHPSGEPHPSPADVKFTQEAVQVGRLLGIDLLDHILIGKGVWLSMKEQGLGFEK